MHCRPPPITARQWAHSYMIPAAASRTASCPAQSTDDPSVRRTPGWEGEMPGRPVPRRLPHRRPRGLRLRPARRLRLHRHLRGPRRQPRASAGRSGRTPSPCRCSASIGPLYAWLETGDPYLLHTARAVIDTAYTWHKNSWPRRAVGRDACFIHGVVLLYRYLGDEHYRVLARDVIRDIGVVAVARRQLRRPGRRRGHPRGGSLHHQAVDGLDGHHGHPRLPGGRPG